MSEQQIQKVRVKRLAHVGLWTTDVAAQTRFYRQAMGFVLRATEINSNDSDVEFEEANTFLALGDEFHCLSLFTDTRPGGGNGRTPAQQSRLHHIAFEVDNDAELAALAARLKAAGVNLALQPRDGNPELGDTLWFADPDGNPIEISVTPDDALVLPPGDTHRTRLHPHALQHIALRTIHMETMVEFYTEALGFDISDWLLRESAWLRCNTDHHTLILMQGKQDIDHIGFSIPNGAELLTWADYLSRLQKPILWGPGRHGAGNDLFIRFADPEGLHIELSAELQQYFDRDVTTPPRLWHSRTTALNLWGLMPSWVRDEVRV
ncbi:MAG TPA: VOC family protein [Ktedonobacteraceae bacterium]|jgi:catechol 2,3-dioxygenase-like lactoylglutathione lyase family enzyme|nr:VOC family protein [Ktedonobacteraceae bacterium]